MSIFAVIRYSRSFFLPEEHVARDFFLGVVDMPETKLASYQTHVDGHSLEVNRVCAQVERKN